MFPYQNIYNLIETYIYGSIENGSFEELVAILFSTGACLFVLAVPFLVVALCIVFICKTVLTLF